MSSELVKAIEAFIKQSGDLKEIAIAIIGGTVLLILSTSFRHPDKKVRKLYFIFIPVWLALGFSIFFGDFLQRNYISLLLIESTNKELLTNVYLKNVLSSMNSSYLWQQGLIMLSIFLLLIWIIIFLIWFVLLKEVKDE